MAERRIYGIGQQWLPNLLEKKAVYVDKTAYVYKLAQHGGINYFLSRPRRFGKSLLVSTLQCYFEGRRELFRGMAVERLETEWTKYPVLRLDLSLGKYYDETSVDDICGGILGRLEDDYGIPRQKGEKLSDRLSFLIKTAYERTGQKVVVLIDEYDAPMLDSIHDETLQNHLRQRVRDLFSPLKGMSEYLRFVFLTGISKFSQLSVFSELNNLTDLTFMPKFEGICGITEDELFTQLKPDIELLAERMGQQRRQPMSYDEAVAELKRMYDGYHFTRRMTDIYNPWSVFYAFDQGWIDNYWFSTGTPSSLISLFRVKQIVMPQLEGFVADMERFNAPTERITDPIPVLFQSGYLTIKDYDYKRKRFTLGFPNAEVYEGFGKSLYNYYCPEYIGSRDRMDNALWDLRENKTTFGEFLESVRRWYAGIPYSVTDKNQNGRSSECHPSLLEDGRVATDEDEVNEQFYEALFYSLMVGLGADVEAEGQTADGRFDIAMKMHDAIYILEFKFGKTALEATEQILTKDYAVRFAADARPVFAVGLNISEDRRTIESYEVVKVKD